MKSLRFLLAISMISPSLFCQDNDVNPVLTIEGGTIVGVMTPMKGIVAYKGVPFAAPPVGDLRWREPQAVVPWEGTKVADKYGAAAEQVTWDPESFYGKEWRASGSVPFSEDCLYLNIWTPAAGQTEKRRGMGCARCHPGFGNVPPWDSWLLLTPASVGRKPAPGVGQLRITRPDCSS